MFDKRKLQVFVSSTYEDLKDERQAAVESILAAGHIPAGMELFAAGDKSQSQMRIIERWIDESDVYLLILGARYGSIEPESGKSYTHLEYEYASKHKKALFVCVIDDKERKIRIKNGSVVEDYPDKLSKFRKLVCSNMVVKFWRNTDKIQLTVFQSMTMDFSKRPELIGWVRSDDIPDRFPKPVRSEVKIGEEFSFEVVKVDARGKIYERLKHTARQRIENAYGVNLEMVYVPAGEFVMGSPEDEEEHHNSESPQHKVTIKQPFYMGKYPITQALWMAVMGTNPSNFEGDKRPVEQVSWDGAVKFCEKLSKLTNKTYRLPSEAEWEYACRAGTTTPFYFGETITTDLSNYDGDSTYGSGPKGKCRKQTTEVGIFPPNAFGLYDMPGNVLEWCADGWHDNYKNAPTDGTVWKKGNKNRVLRGGSWTCDSTNVRSANRGWLKLTKRYNYIGFRVVRML
ncbi:SUMF1/EgtB/PvdO family nonheme iron enzyme [Thiotrichales bacterium HSG1]|nr:SUMF1/EgtB/PvdO family nonheme iron enzyme [Thiotrichales bacterium HSG1]